MPSYVVIYLVLKIIWGSYWDCVENECLTSLPDKLTIPNKPNVIWHDLIIYLEYRQQHSLINRNDRLPLESSINRNYNMHVCENNSFNELTHKIDKKSFVLSAKFKWNKKISIWGRMEKGEVDLMYLQNFWVHEDKSVEWWRYTELQWKWLK